jgi:hypothetical protein
VLALSGCANSAWYAASPGTGGGSAGPPPGGSVRVVTADPTGAWLALGILLGAVYGPYFGPAPEMDPNRRVVEQDCSKPLADTSGNLRCR